MTNAFYQHCFFGQRWKKKNLDNTLKRELYNNLDIKCLAENESRKPTKNKHS